MNSLRLLIVDDEPLIRTGIHRMVSRFDAVEVIGECRSGADAIQAIGKSKPDVVLLDIQLPDCTGFDIVRAIGPEMMPAVVFVTGYDEYAIRAFEINAVDYLLKPFDEDRLRASVERARARVAMAANESVRLDALLQSPAQEWASRLLVRNGDRVEFVPTESIDWVESANNYVHLHCGKSSHLLAEPLTSLQGRLDPGRFQRVHRCYLVNVSRITAISSPANGSYELELSDGARIRTGRSYGDTVRTLLKPKQLGER